MWAFIFSLIKIKVNLKVSLIRLNPFEKGNHSIEVRLVDTATSSNQQLIL